MPRNKNNKKKLETMIRLNRIFTPVKLILTDPQDVEDLRRAIEDSIHKLDNKYWGLSEKEVSPKHADYYNRMKYLLISLQNIPLQKDFQD